MTTYTVFNTQDSSIIYGRGLTAVDAMDIMLSDDGYRWEIRHEDGCYHLYHSDGSANSTRGAAHMVETVIFSVSDDKNAAENEIAEKVIAAGWSRLPTAMTDEDFAAMQAQIAAEDAA